MSKLRLGLGPLQLSPVRPQRKAANQPPVVAHAIPDQNASEGTAFSFQFATNAFSDPDGDTLTYAATLVGGGGLPAWLTFTPATRTFSGTPGAGDFADLSIRVTATDPGGLSAHDDFVLAVNGKPVVANAIANQNASEGTVFSFQFAANAFSDPDGDTLTYAATLVGGGGLPAWLTFTPATRTFSGTPGAGDFADLSIRVTATDPGGLSAHDDFVLAVNGKPIVANAIPSQTAIATLAYSLQFAANTFSDPDGDTLAYSATLSNGNPLPSWLTFTPATRTFSGTPAHTDNGSLTVRVTATDPGGLSGFDDFALMTYGLPASGLAREYRFVAGSGQQLTDFSGNGAHGQLGSTSGSDSNDPTWASSPARLDFDGSDDYVSFPITGLPSGHADLTMIAAFRTSGTGQQDIVGYGTNSSSKYPQLQVANSTQVQFGLFGNLLAVTVTGGVQNKDLVAACRYRASDDAQHLNVPQTGNSGSRTASPVLDIGTSAGWIGRSIGGTLAFNGRIYFVIIYSRRLSDAEVTQAYQYIKAHLALRSVTV